MHPDRSDLITKDRELLFNVLTSYIIKFKLHFMYIFAYVIFIRFVIRYEHFEFMVNFDLNTIWIPTNPGIFLDKNSGGRD